MSTHKSKVSNTVITTSRESWLTKQQAAQVLGVAEKTIDRMAKAGELHKEILKRPRQAPIVVFHPGDVNRAKAAREAQQSPAPFVMSEKESGLSADVSGRPVSDVSRSMSEVSVPWSDSWIRDMSTRLSNLSKIFPAEPTNLWLTLQEAADYSGLPAAVLVDFINSGRLPALDIGRRRGGHWRIRKVDLRKLDAGVPQSRQDLLPNS